MGHGGARNRSGPAPDPRSGRSERRGLRFDALPAVYEGEVPEFPLPGASGREVEVWESVWRGPQGNAWCQPSERWRWLTIGLYVRVFVACEAFEGLPSGQSMAQLHRLADQVGLTPAGLRENGWVVARDEVGERASRRDEEASGGDGGKRRRRLTVAQ